MSAQDAQKLSKKVNEQSRIALSKLGSTPEEILARHLQVNKLTFEREFRFNPNRQFRADFYLADFNLLVEVEGGTRGKSRHTQHDGYSKDLIKYNSAQILGYSRLAFTSQQVTTGLAIETIKTFIEVYKQRVEHKKPVNVSPNPVIKEMLHGELT
jgi:very-short-patch-repair endonuclease